MFSEEEFMSATDAMFSPDHDFDQDGLITKDEWEAHHDLLIHNDVMAAMNTSSHHDAYYQDMNVHDASNMDDAVDLLGPTEMAASLALARDLSEL
jgi:hypothetical protein